MKRERRLRWRVLRGSHLLDLVEERGDELPTAFVGLIDGREAARASSQSGAGAALIRAALR